MTTQQLYIRQITPRTNSWKVKVMVCEKKLNQDVLFREQKVIATLYGDDINLFDDMFRLYETYTILNAKVTLFSDQLQCDQLERKNVIPRNTLIFNFAPSSALQSLAGNQALIGKLNFTNSYFLGFFFFFWVFFEAFMIICNLVADVLSIVVEKRGLRHLIVSGQSRILKEYAIMSDE
ncbi:hypothetical protein ACJIZ3_006155 [Penstemon smallii]|uniref:Uncharacterized protein n=1 Tax=Penstemon smallii TaxID=265156 RepID=A0ABD3S6X5_9LAMI